MEGSKTIQLDPPRRGSFQDNPHVVAALQRSTATETEILRGSLEKETQQVNAEAVAQNQAVAVDDDAMLTDDDFGFTKSFSASRRASMTPLVPTNTNTDNHQSPSSDGDAIEVNQGPYQLPLAQSGRAGGKLKNKYVLSDGSVVNGKGLGRGRPGFKRGPRKSGLSTELIETSPTTPASLSTPPPVTQQRSTSGKRKRTDADLNDVKDDDYDDDDDALDSLSRESTPEYIPAASTQTRSGRQSQKPVQIKTTSSTTASPATKRPALTPTISSPLIKKHPKIKAKVYRGREQFALCEHCLRGNGPPGNVIVFCDACNKCWHQRCHDPKISKEVVADTKAEWFCSDCDRILHGKKKNKIASKPTVQPAQAPPIAAQVATPNMAPIMPYYGPPLIPGMNFTLAQRKHYLHSLSKDRLIDVVLRAADMAPNMPIFETPYFPAAQPQAGTSLSVHPQQHPHAPQTSNSAIPLMAPPTSHAQLQPIPPAGVTIPVYSHPTAGIPSKPNTQPSQVSEDDEGYYDDYDEMALLYPKPGEGVYNLALPPESAALGILLEGPECRTFSHWVRGQDTMKSAIDGTQ